MEFAQFQRMVVEKSRHVKKVMEFALFQGVTARMKKLARQGKAISFIKEWEWEGEIGRVLDVKVVGWGDMKSTIMKTNLH